MRRGELITNPTIAFCVIYAGSHLFHEKAVLSPSQMKTWPISRLIEKVREKKIFEAKEGV